MSGSRTWKQRLMGGAGLIFVVLGLLVALGGVIVLFSDVGAGFSILAPGLVVAAAGARLRGYARGETGTTTVERPTDEA